MSPRQLTFTRDARRQSVQVRALQDTRPEPDETLQVGIGTFVTRIRIADDDREGRLLPMTGTDDVVGALVALPTGGVAVGGDFRILDETPRSGFALCRAEGRIDPESAAPVFRSSPVEMRGIPPARINAMVPDALGRWLVGGYLGQVDGQAAGHLVRLKSDGRLDPTFKNPGFNGGVWNVLEQSDGRLVVAGTFERVGGQPMRGLARLLGDGSFDASFQARPGFEGWLGWGSALAELPDGRLLVGGWLEKYNGQTVQNLVRLFPDGTLDTTFPLLRTGASGRVATAVVLPDGRTYVGGFFDTIGGRSHRRLARLTAEGAVDTSYKAPNPNGEVNCLLPLPNGQLVVGGAFTRIANTARRFVALLNEDGTLDTSFDLGSGAGDHVWALAAAGDGSLYLGGAFTTFNGQPARHLARIRLPEISGSLSGANWHGDGRFTTRVWGLPGARYPIETSTNLQNWEPMGEVRIQRPDHTAPFDPPLGSGPRFFRVNSRTP